MKYSWYIARNKTTIHKIHMHAKKKGAEARKIP
jgi:hypothetical protein